MNYETGDVPAHFRDVMNKCIECGDMWIGVKRNICTDCQTDKDGHMGKTAETAKFSLPQLYKNDDAFSIMLLHGIEIVMLPLGAGITATYPVTPKKENDYCLRKVKAFAALPDQDDLIRVAREAVFSIADEIEKEII